MISKSQLKQQIDLLPEKFTIDELMERLVFVNKVESGIKDSKNNEKISENELVNLIKKWVV